MSVVNMSREFSQFILGISFYMGRSRAGQGVRTPALIFEMILFISNTSKWLEPPFLKKIPPDPPPPPPPLPLPSKFLDLHTAAEAWGAYPRILKEGYSGKFVLSLQAHSACSAAQVGALDNLVPPKISNYFAASALAGIRRL